MSIESVLGIMASLIAIGTLVFQGFQKYQNKGLSDMFTELADKNTTIKRQHRLLRLIDINIKTSGFSISKTYIDGFISNGRSKSAIFHDLCIQNSIEPTKSLCMRVFGYDEPTFRKEWHKHQVISRTNTHNRTKETSNETSVSMNNRNHNSTIQDWDTNFVYISDMLKEVFPDFYERLCNKFDEMGIQYGEIIGTKDIWCRDYMPIQVAPTKFIGYKYNPDYLNSDDLAFPHISKYSHLTYRDAITDQNDVWSKNGFSRPNLLSSDIVLDGGNVVVVGNYILLTDKIYQENNCSSPSEEKDLLNKIERIFGLSPVVISWEAKGDDVYGHTDGMIKAIPSINQPKSVIISPLFKNERQKLHKELGTYFNIKDIEFDVRGKDFEKYAWAYINFLQVGNKILVPSFGLPCENSVLAQIQLYFPDCKVDTIEMREIADQGGALHCITWNIIK